MTLTLTLKLDLDMVKMYLHTKNEVSMSRGSKVLAWTDRNTDRQTETQTDMTKNITYLHTRVAKNLWWGMRSDNDQITTNKYIIMRDIMAVITRGPRVMMGLVLSQCSTISAVFYETKGWEFRLGRPWGVIMCLLLVVINLGLCHSLN